MISFQYGVCPKCGHKGLLVINNNPLLSTTICFNCVSAQFDPHNLDQADFFCRTFNLPFNPQLWIDTASKYGPDTFHQYESLILDDPSMKPNLYYTSSTHDLWLKTTKEWAKTRSFAEILNKITPIRDSYIERGRLKWGTQYTFEELIKLDSIYTRTLKANNITNPLQKEAVKTLCKLQIEMDQAIAAKDAKSIKDFSTAWSTFAKQADLEGMINDTKTDDITTVAELYDYMERNGFQFKYFSGAAKDEVDRAIKDIQDTNRRLVLEATGLQDQLEDMAKKREETRETEHAAKAQAETPLKDLLNFDPNDVDIAKEDDEEVKEAKFDEDDAKSPVSSTPATSNTTAVPSGESAASIGEINASTDHPISK